jgi:hypothetical protein
MVDSGSGLNRASKIHIAFSVFWTLMLIPTIIVFKESVLWVAFISIYALIIGHISSYEAANNKAVDDATHFKLNAIAQGLADFMHTYADQSDEDVKQVVYDDIEELKKAVGIEEEM